MKESVVSFFMAFCFAKEKQEEIRKRLYERYLRGKKK